MHRDNRLNELDKAPIGKLLFKYSLPSVVGMVVMSVYNIIDRMFIGQGVGPDAIAGLAITFPVMNVSAAFGVLIGGGAGARTSIVLGQGKKRTAEEILGNSLVMTLLLGTFYLTLFAIFIDVALCPRLHDVHAAGFAHQQPHVLVQQHHALHWLSQEGDVGQFHWCRHECDIGAHLHLWLQVGH